uniref:endonuclease 8-like 1 isoform X2 n=1 Tax=Pristiophorus japonicus TaxID=55135 RepID=UPI00398E7B46
MPEGPELHLASRFVNRVCSGAVFSGKVEKSAVSKNCEVPFECDAYVISAASRGKEVKLTLTPIKEEDVKPPALERTKGLPGPMDIVFRFGMSGSFKLTSEEEVPKHAHLKFFTNGRPRQVLCFVDARRFGSWEVHGTWQLDRGPCVMFEYEKFRLNVLSNLSDKAFDKPICEVLLNQKYFNGIGNYLRAEILFRLKVPPFEKARTVLEPLLHKETTAELTLSKKIKLKLENPDLLELCHMLPTEVINLDGKGYDPEHSDDSSAFEAWLRCYYVAGMQLLRDGNGRTIWFQGIPGPMAPKGSKTPKPKSRRRKTTDETENKELEPEGIPGPMAPKGSKTPKPKSRRRKTADETENKELEPEGIPGPMAPKGSKTPKPKSRRRKTADETENKELEPEGIPRPMAPKGSKTPKPKSRRRKIADETENKELEPESLKPQINDAGNPGQSRERVASQATLMCEVKSRENRWIELQVRKDWRRTGSEVGEQSRNCCDMTWLLV